MWQRPCVTSGESWLYVRVITRSLRVVLLMFNHQLSLQTELLFVLFGCFAFMIHQHVLFTAALILK